jgi:hypothetical protein
MGKRHPRLLAWLLAGLGLGGAFGGPDLRASADFPYKGMSYAGWSAEAYSSADSDLSLEYLSRTGSTWVSLVVTGYQDNLASTTIYRNEATPTDEGLTRALDRAHALGLKVLLKPHLDLWDDPAHWRGEIGGAFRSEVEWQAWFEAYRGFIAHYADLARTRGADMFCVGTELEGTTSRAAEWRRVVAEVRSRFAGPLIYAANHGGEEERLSWWDTLDVVGVDAYYALAGAPHPTLTELKSSWTTHRDELAALAARWQKQVVLTEIGYRSIAGTASHPWDWQVQGEVDLREQADCYQAVKETFDGLSWFGGLFWWSWGPDPYEGGPCDDGYSPHDKPAEAVVRDWYGAPTSWKSEPRLEPDDSRVLDLAADGFEPGWEDWSWGARIVPCDTSRAYAGACSVGVNLEPWGALSLRHDPFTAWPKYRFLEFCLYAPSARPPELWVYFYDREGKEMARRRADDCRYLPDGFLRLDDWNPVLIPLRHLLEPGRGLSRICLEDRSGQGETGFWVDRLRLVGARRALPGERTPRQASVTQDR